MKKIFYGALLAALVCGASACTNEVDEAFGQSASERLEQQMVECKQLLISAQYGWMIEYYPDSNQSFGGCTYAARFDADGNVTVTGEVAAEVGGDVSKTITSHYSINSSSSVVLTFDTYNEYIHYWSDPDDFGGNYYDGDFEFAYVSGDAGQMVFRGIKTGNRIVFTALEEDLVSSMKKISDVQNAIIDKLYWGYTWNAGAQDAAESADEPQIALYDDDTANILTYYPDGDMNGAYENYPYAFSADGIRLYEPIVIDGVSAQHFRWENEMLVATDATDAAGAPTTVTLKGFHSESFVHYDTFLGDYRTSFWVVNNSSFSRIPVTIKEKKRYQSYTLSGLAFDVELGYSKNSGQLTMLFQHVGSYQGNPVYFFPWDSDQGFVALTTAVGFDIVKISEDPAALTLQFFDNGAWGGNTVSGIIFGIRTSGISALAMYYPGFGDMTMTKL